MNALALIVLLPFIGAVAVLATGSRPNLRECLSLGAGITLVGLVVSLLPAVFAGERPVSVLAVPIPGIPYRTGSGTAWAALCVDCQCALDRHYPLLDWLHAWSR